jgi:hypothetical protein
MSCNKTDWKENFKEKEKSPFGNYIIYNEAKNLFKTEEITLLKENIYDYLLFDEKSEIDLSTYILIKHTAYKITENGVIDLLSYANAGNTVFLSLNYFSDDLKEKLGFTTNNLDKDVYTVSDLRELKGNFYLENESFGKEPYLFDRNIRRHYFLEYNKNSTIVLGNTKIDGEKVPNFIKIYYGKGAIYLHSNPVVFTNYYMLDKKENYAENVFSYLPSKKTIWDPHKKSSKYSDKNEEDTTAVFKFFLRYKTLTWFLVVSLAGILLFMLFNARRKQRAIPIKVPLKNTTVAFTQTIANLYLKEEDHKNLVDKKVAFFLEKVRTKYLINTSNLNADFIKKLAAKSGNELQRTKYLINSIIALNKKDSCSEEELIGLYKMIENFFKK